MQTDTTPNPTFDGLAFPVVRVRYTGGHWNATLQRDRDRTYRARTLYDHEIGGGARGARAAALKCWQKARADVDPSADVDSHVAIPGDYDANTYIFVMVDREILERHYGANAGAVR